MSLFDLDITKHFRVECISLFEFGLFGVSHIVMHSSEIQIVHSRASQGSQDQIRSDKSPKALMATGSLDDRRDYSNSYRKGSIPCFDAPESELIMIIKIIRIIFDFSRLIRTKAFSKLCSPSN